MYTTIYGPWYGGSGKGRFVVDIEDIGAVTKDTAGVWVRSNWYLEFSQATWDASNTFDPNGSFEQNPFGPVNIGTSSNPVTRALIWEKDIYVNLQYGSTTGIHVAGNIVGINNVGTTIYVDQWFNLPARPYQLPNPATSFTNTYVNDNKIDLAWTANYTGANGATPWSNQNIDRTETGDWAGAMQVAWLGWEPTSWSDTSVQPNKRYNYRHNAINPAGSSTYAYAANAVYTTPAAPNKPTFAKQADGSVKITAKNNSPWATKYRIDDSADGNTWTTLTSTGTISALGADIVHTQSSPNNAVTHRYRVMVQTPDGKWSAASPTSDILQLQAPPNPPTWAVIDPAFDATSAITTPWTHNPVDSTPQTAYEVQWRSSADNGATWTAWTTTGKVTSTTSSRTWAANTFPQNRLIERQVKTWGAHANSSAWSASATFKTSAKPTTGITSPANNSTFQGKYITAAWNYADVEGTAQSAWEVLLFKVGDTEAIGLWTGTGSQSTFAIPTALEDDTSYRIEVRVRDGVGLWSNAATSQVLVDYLPPPAPIVTVEWDKLRGAAIIMIVNPMPTGSEPAAVKNRIYRDGVLIADNVKLDTTYIDLLPLTTGSTYTVESESALPSSNTTVAVLGYDEEVGRRFWLNGGNGWHQVASYYGNVNRDHTTELAGDEEHYSGRTLPVLTIGEAVTETFGFSTTVEQVVDNPANFHALVRTPGVVCFREPSGRYFVSLRRVSEGTTQSFTAEMSFSMKIVDYKEGVTE